MTGAIGDLVPGPPEDLLEAWDLEVDGEPRSGHMSTVWPVRGGSGGEWVLKVTDAHHRPTGEAAALRAWGEAGAPVVGVVRDEGRALLLERLDAAHDLKGVPDAQEADEALADLLAGLAGVPAGDLSVPRLADEVTRMLAGIERHTEEAPGVLPELEVGRARSALRELLADLEAPGAELELLHLDLHYLNVLAPLESEFETGTGAVSAGARWVVIDPLPHAGLREIEVVAALRNRWDDAVATGDADGALRRRLALLCERAGLDLQRATHLAQAVAVDNLLWLLPREPDSPFVRPYEVLSRW